MTTPDDALPGAVPEATPPDGALPDEAMPDETIDGYSVERLSDYLDSGRSPRDAGIEGSAACRLYLISLAQVHDLSRASLESEATREPDRDGLWISSLLESIRREVVGGREIPIGHPDPGIDLRITEAAARGLVRRTATPTAVSCSAPPPSRATSRRRASPSRSRSRPQCSTAAT